MWYRNSSSLACCPCGDTSKSGRRRRSWETWRQRGSDGSVVMLSMLRLVGVDIRNRDMGFGRAPQIDRGR